MNTFDELLNAYWLRPETALWRELDIRAMQGFEFSSPSLDIGCGDGLFSFIRAQGRMSTDFDAFRYVDNLDKFFQNIDVYDAYGASEEFEVLSAPAYKIDIGLDHKESLLRKSQILKLYSDTLQGDANKALPFENGYFNSIFSNIVYWLNDPKFVISEIARILKTNGKLCLLLPNHTLPNYSFYSQLYIKSGNPKWAFLQKLDRGRFSQNIQQARSRSDWEKMFSDAGLRVVAHKNYLSKTTVQLWDIRLRPMFPLLKKMTDLLSPADFLNIKKEWVETLHMFLDPMLELDAEQDANQEPAFHCYILEKNSN